MNNDATSHESAAPAASVPSPARTASPRAPEPRSHGGALALAVLLSLIAAGGAGYVGWQQWQQARANAAASQTLDGLSTRTATLESTLQSMDAERRTLRERLRDADDVNRGMREELLGQNERLRNLEDAVAKLSEKSLSGHDAMLLDETESLLRMGKERYELFHDADGAAKAYALADQALSSVDDGAFSGLRQSVAAEREALEQRASVHADATLQRLQQLRGALGDLPLKPLDAPAATNADGVWARIGHALAGVVSIERDNGAPMAVADARLTRELVALDLAHAESALLARDEAGYLGALQRAQAGLAAQFDGNAAAVKQAQDTLAELAKTAQPSKPVELGAALTELRNLRAVHALKPAAAPAGAKP
ncbi:uroporphyrinogen-III C-methyltransferase [Dyella sp. KULCS107]|uniref:uroporphyrinogen-III C-methyltransferase n=1 Tax=Dyella sp. KULCS107 TaxID=3422216 RepID=UPI003D7006FF